MANVRKRHTFILYMGAPVDPCNKALFQPQFLNPIEKEPKMNLQGFPPHCYLIGAQKAGTTYLAKLLDQHPQIHVSSPKETDFFTGRIYPRGLEWYRQCFPEDTNKILIDASTSYSAALPLQDPRTNDETISYVVPGNGVARRILETVPDARFIYILRNPIKRTYSAYYHFIRTGEEKRLFKDVITTDDSRREYYFLLSNYFVQLEHYLQYTEMSRIKVMLFEEFINNPEKHLQDCFHFLGIDDNVSINFGSGTHPSYQYSSPLRQVNQLLAPWGGLRPILGQVKKILPEALVKQGMRIVTASIPLMEREDYLMLKDYFLPCIEALEKMLNKNLHDLWLEK